MFDAVAYYSFVISAVIRWLSARRHGTEYKRHITLSHRAYFNVHYNMLYCANNSTRRSSLSRLPPSTNTILHPRQWLIDVITLTVCYDNSWWFRKTNVWRNCSLIHFHLRILFQRDIDIIFYYKFTRYTVALLFSILIDSTYFM